MWLLVLISSQVVGENMRAKTIFVLIEMSPFRGQKEKNKPMHGTVDSLTFTLQ